MKDITEMAFESLFTIACEKCFGVPLTAPLTESDSRLLSTAIYERTGLVIGQKSIRNYSLYVLHTGEGRKENPSIATLDTFARYVLNAPATDEATRKEKEPHFPYWFQYKSRFITKPKQGSSPRSNTRWSGSALAVLLTLTIGFLFLKPLMQSNGPSIFSDHFDRVDTGALEQSGWTVENIDTAWWNKRMLKPGHLSLYTLPGDNWPKGEENTEITNLLVREIPIDCFSAEVHLTNFIPRENWQQAGMLLSEDPGFRGKVLRLSISYNDFFGGYKQLPEIIIQALSSSESGDKSKPEEIAHHTIFLVDSTKNNMVEKNLERAALKIERNGTRFRFLYSAGASESFAFREVVSGDFTIDPKYIGIFAMQGHASNSVINANFDSFKLVETECGD